MTPAGAHEDAVAWRLSAPSETQAFVFDDGVMVFNPLSWDTHLLNDSAALVLDELAEGPRSLDELVAALTMGREPEGGVDRFREEVRFALENMASLGLVRAEPRREVR